MSANKQFSNFHAAFVSRLEKQTGLNFGEYAALVLSGQNPSHRSAVYSVSQKMRKKLRKGKKIEKKDITALLDMVDDYHEYQELSPKDRVTFSRQILTKIIPTVTSADLESTTAGEVTKVIVDEAFKDEMRSIIEDEL